MNIFVDYQPLIMENYIKIIYFTDCTPFFKGKWMYGKMHTTDPIFQLQDGQYQL